MLNEANRQHDLAAKFNALVASWRIAGGTLAQTAETLAPWVEHFPTLCFNRRTYLGFCNLHTHLVHLSEEFENAEQQRQLAFELASKRVVNYIKHTIRTTKCVVQARERYA